jgi:hypothetical protein
MSCALRARPVALAPEGTPLIVFGEPPCSYSQRSPKVPVPARRFARRQDRMAHGRCRVRGASTAGRIGSITRAARRPSRRSMCGLRRRPWTEGIANRTDSATRSRITNQPLSPEERPMTSIQETGEKVAEQRRARDRRQATGSSPDTRGPAVPRPSADRGRARAPARRCWPRPLRAASAAASGASSSRRTCSRRTSPAFRSTTSGLRSSSSGRARSWPRWYWPTRSTAPRPRRSRRSSNAWRSTRPRSTAPPTRCPSRSS